MAETTGEARAQTGPPSRMDVVAGVLKRLYGDADCDSLIAAHDVFMALYSAGYRIPHESDPHA